MLDATTATARRAAFDSAASDAATLIAILLRHAISLTPLFSPPPRPADYAMPRHFAAAAAIFRFSPRSPCRCLAMTPAPLI